MTQSAPHRQRLSAPVSARVFADTVNHACRSAAGQSQLPLKALFEAAVREDTGEALIAGSVGSLAAAGRLLWKERPSNEHFADLVAVAEVNLPLARLYEGHINALKLVRNLGDLKLQASVRQDADNGLLFGVWGAEGAEPLAVRGAYLSGGKRFASGLGTVSRAVVTLGEGAAVRLAVIDVSEIARHSAETWCKTGMRATVSGDFNASGMPATALQWLGSPGQYLQEPGFIGGVWRIAAVQVGGVLGLLRATIDHLAALGRMGAEAQVARLAPVLTRALAAAEFTRRAARCAEGPEGRLDPERAASLSAQARLLTEDVGQDAIAAAERAVGLPHFDVDAPSGRIARDLATYMRQAARDALVQRSGTWALGQEGPYSQLLHSEDPDAQG